MKQHKLKVRLLSMLTALTMLTALFPPAATALSGVTLYYTNGDAATYNYDIPLRSYFNQAGVKYAEDYDNLVNSVTSEDSTICYVLSSSVRIEEINGMKRCKFSIVPCKVGKTTITLKITTYPYGFDHDVKVSRSQDISIDVTECPNHNVVQEEITDSYNVRSCSACGFHEKKPHTYNEQHICTVCNHKCTHISQNKYQTSTGHYTVCTACGYTTDTEAHTYKQKAGDKTYHYCSVCNYKQNHSFGAWQVVGDQRKRNCEICGYVDTGESEKRPHSQNSAHNLCNDSECTIASHKLPTSGTNRSWTGANSDTTLIYAYPIGSDTPSSYYLYNIIKSGTTLTGEWTIPNFVTGKKLYNCLNGNRLTLLDGAYIHIQSGETYSLTDCRKGIGDIYGGTNGVIKIDKGGTFDFYEGTITGNSGDGIIVNNGTMNLYGGTIMNNTGAAIINNGTLNIYGGTITNNTGGGIIGTGTINFKKVDCSTGNPVIANNTIDGKTCNIKGASKISVTALGEEASVGFTPATAVTAGTPVEISANGGEYYSCFVSDSDDYVIIQNGNGIQLIAAHSVLEHHAANAATCTEGGNEEYWSCVDCNRLYSDKDGNTEIYAIPTTEATGHSLTHHEEKAATCTESGNSAYWECTSCGTLFSDENGETEIDDIPTIPAIGQHTWGAWEITKPASETEDGEKQHTCTVCNETEKQVIPATGTGDTEKFNIRYEGGNAIVTAPIAGTYTVLFAAYDNGRLTSLSAQTKLMEKGETTVEPQGFTANGKIKVMLWENLTSMKPLCGVAEQVLLAE